MSINETVLEMHFHHAIMSEVRQTLGLGKGKFNFYKYSPQKECFVGFDQAFVKTDLSEKDLFDKLKKSSTENGYGLSNFFVGIFFQFKVVKVLQRRSRVTPLFIKNTPHYRASLDTKKNINTGFSQHELLFNLNKNKGAFVYYACPMVFDRTELYSVNPDLSRLRLADVSTCPSIYSDNDSHFIYFEDKTSNPVWCSEPVEGEALSVSEFAETLKEKISTEDYEQTQKSLLDEMQNSYTLKNNNEENNKVKLLEIMHESFVIIQYEKENPNRVAKGL